MEQLSHTYATSSREPRQALAGVSFEVRKGEIFGLLGPNGGGKTTLLQILCTLLTPSGGRAAVLGGDVVAQSSLVRRRIGVVFQSPSLDKKLKLRENLLCQGHLYGLSGASLKARVDELLERFKLSDRAQDYVEVLSGGLQRRAEIAKGLLHRPELLILDEPSVGLDPGARRDMWLYLRELRKSGVSILITTHLMEEADQCDRLMILHQGRQVALGTPAALKEEVGGDVVRVSSQEPGALAPRIQEKFQVIPVLLDGSIRIEIEKGHQFIPNLIEAFPGAVDSVTVGKPTLEDVFVHHTGQDFFEGAS